MFRVSNLASATLSSSFSNATNSMPITTPGGNLFPTSAQLANGAHTVCIASIEDGGVTQANPELVLLQGSFSATLLVTKKRGFLGTTVPASWPVGANVHLLNTAEFFSMMGSNTMGYTFQVGGHINSATPGNPGGDSLRTYANGSALPSNTDNITIDANPGGWDLGDYLVNFVSGDLVRMRWLYFNLTGSTPLVSGATLGYLEHRFEAKLSGAPVDNTGWWTLPITTASVQMHADIPDSSDGIQGMVIFDLVKLV